MTATVPWHKIYTIRTSSLMQEHPNDIVGMWFKVWCSLSNSKYRWYKEASIDVWAKIVGENQDITRKFIYYIRDNFVDIRVSVKIKNQIRYITIEDEFYQHISGKSEVNSKKTKKFKEQSPLHLNRMRMLKSVIESYHINRRTIQITKARNSFFRIMRDASRREKVTNSDKKIEVEKLECEKIHNHIKWLKTTDVWKQDEGKYLPGIGKLIESRAWEYNVLSNKDKRDKNKYNEDNKNILMSSIEESHIGA